MYGHHHLSEDAAANEAADRQTASLAAVAVILVLLVGGLFLVQQLRSAAQFQDCLLSGRHNCEDLTGGQR